MPMSRRNEAQVDYWNGRAGETWAAMQSALDGMLRPVTVLLTSRAGSLTGQRVLDVGCGTGETCTLWLAAGAEVTGLDVSAPMLAVAMQRTSGKALIVQADASVWQGTAPFDLAVSRFGVMFFEDPTAAFRNIATNLRPGGRLLFACWRAVAENPWVTTPMAAIHDLLPDAPAPAPGAPGPFAFADAARVRGILTEAGFVDVTIQAEDVAISLAAEGGVEAAVRFVTRIGPAGAALAGTNDEARAQAAHRLATALRPHEQDGSVSLAGAVWMVSATRPG